MLTLLLIAQLQVVTQQGLQQETQNWETWTQGKTSITVTGNNPRYGYGDVGSGSLQMRINGNMTDWGFVKTTGEFGLLSQLTSVSFDWFRSSTPNWDAESVGDVTLYDWKYKSPAFRLLLGDDTELVWESYFNREINNDLSYIDTWNTSNVLNGNFWYRSGDGYSLLGSACTTGAMNVWDGTAQPITVSEMINCYGDREVTGVAVGLGSQWPYEYKGYVDNVRLSSNNAELLNANFDIHTSTVPEPATYMMMLIGLVGIGFFARRKRLS
jgi:hypothetical protein